MSSQTAEGRSGVRSIRTPKGDSASATALTTAGVDASVPDSPTPRTPRGVSDGVTIRSNTIRGTSSADGSRYDPKLAEVT